MHSIRLQLWDQLQVMSAAYQNELFRARTTVNASLVVALLKLPQRAFLLWLYLPGYLKT
jgi:hypothetical protein